MTSAIFTKEINSGVLIDTVTTGIPRAATVITPASDYMPVASSVRCTTNCTITYEFIRLFKNEGEVDVISAVDNTYDFFGF
jgi:hypothetical protein